MATSVNGLVTPELADVPNIPADLKRLADGVDDRYGLSVADEAALLALTGNFDGRRVKVISLGQTATWDATSSTWGGYWKDYTPTVGWTNLAVTTAKYLRQSKLVTVKFLLTVGGSAPTGTFALELPSTASESALEAVGVVMLRDNSAGDTSRRSGTIFLPSTTTASVLVDSLTTAAIISSTVPWTQAANDTIGGTLQYHEA